MNAHRIADTIFLLLGAAALMISYFTKGSIGTFCIGLTFGMNIGLAVWNIIHKFK